MKIDIQDLLSNSFVISISEFRYKIFCQRFKEYGLNIIPKLYVGFEIPNGIYKETGLVKTKNICNCFFTHIALVKMAQSLNMEYICIFEDDALPCRNIKTKLDYYLQDIPDDIDLIKLGHLGNLKNVTPVDKYFTQTKTVGSHAYIVFKKYYEKYIEISKKDLHIDRLCMNMSKGQKVYATKELLFIQDDRNFTDTLHNNKKYFDRLLKNGEIGDFEI